jgi:hypothetical protein
MVKKNTFCEKLLIFRTILSSRRSFMEAKEQFSDGVGYNWIDELIDYCATQVTEEQLAGAAIEFPYNSPATKEAYFTGLFLISTIQTTAAQTVRNGFQNGKKIWIQVEEQIRHTCKRY